MKEIILLTAIVAMMARGYFLMGKTGSFVDNIRKKSSAGRSISRQNIIIASQTADMIEYIQWGMDSFTTGRPDIAFTIKKGGASLDMLGSGRADIVLVDRRTARQAGSGLATRHLGDKDAVLVWAKNRQAAQLRRVATALQNAGYSLKAGYPDYID